MPDICGLPLDERGRLLHEDDPAAQLALGVVRLEEALALDGRALADLDRIALLTPDPARIDSVHDVLTERLAELALDIRVDVVTTELPETGMLVAVRGEVRRPRLLVTVAHPDDEAFGCGSVLAHATRSGVDSTVVCATRGELGEPAPGSGLTRAELPAARERELRDACALLGVGRVEVLGYLDSGVDGEPAAGSLAAADPVALRDRIAALIDLVRPDVVVTLDASDGHRDHAAVRDATVAALDVVDRRPRATYLYCLSQMLMTEFTGVATLGTPDADITTLVDVTDLLGLRWQAIRAHASQTPPFDAMDAVLQEAFLAVDRLRRVDPPWPGGPPEDTWLPVPRRTPAAPPTPTKEPA